MNPVIVDDAVYDYKLIHDAYVARAEIFEANILYLDEVLRTKPVLELANFYDNPGVLELDRAHYYHD
jgi:hypothetical protein